MYNVRDLNLKPQRSFYTRESPKESTHSGPLCKSDINVTNRNEYAESCCYIVDPFGHSDGEYYKNYEHDEIPVRECSLDNPHNINGGKASLTNSDLNKLETKIYSNISEELQTDESAVGSLESNIKFFRTTVQEIFDNFYASMKDFELYKKRFHEILEKNREEALDDMDDFIKDMIQHIRDSETSVSNDSKSTEMFQITYNDTNGSSVTPSNISESNGGLVASDVTKPCSSTNKEEIFNIFSVNSDPCVQIKMNDRNFISEINMKRSRNDFRRKQVASADNLYSLTAKKVELENYVRQQDENKVSDIEIPVKVSYAKKDIHLNEDFVNSSGDSKSLITRLCNFLCKKFRKTALG